MTNTADATSTIDLDAIRAELPALAHSTYLNTGGLGPTPRAATAEALRLYQLIGEYGNDTRVVRRELDAGAALARTTLARTFGVRPEHIAFMRAVSEGLSAVGHGLDWREGDEVVITDQEHPAGILPWLTLRDRYGIVVRCLPVSDAPANSVVLLDNLSSLLGPRTRIVALSHVTTETGVRLPAREICALVHERCPAAAVGFDGAQSAGQFPIDLAEIGCDFYSATGYKWLLGHHGTSFLYIRYIRPDWLPRLKPSWSGPGASARLDRQTLAWDPQPTPTRFEFGGRHWPLYSALGKAVRLLSDVGLAAIEARSTQLAGRLKAELSAIPGVTVYTPAAASLCTGIVTAGLAGWTGSDLIATLRTRWNITGRAAHGNRAIRLSVAFFTSDEEIDAVLTAFRSLAR
ncbi:MAG: aminotransferase class V-fold PLP-dependent enzyme [Chloroflexi bacterium]|nr:aminotransferase class V-fold PLP-dependent enzyme [Chloroflexota bacterium]